MDLQKLVESKMSSMRRQKEQLVEHWGIYLGAIDNYLKEKENRSLESYERQNIAQCLENALIESGMRNTNRLFENTTTTSNIAFLGIQLPVIAALLPSLALNQLAIVQALDRRQGAVFFLDVQHGTAKGSIAKDSTLIGAKVGHTNTIASRRYATEDVLGEVIGAAGSTSYSGTLTFFPIRAGTVVVTDGTETFTDNGLGVLVSSVSGGANGTINYTTGAFAVTFDVTTTVIPTGNYEYRYELVADGAGVPEVNINLTSETVTAKDFPLRAKYTVGAAIDLEKAHGISLEDELVKFLGGEIKFEIDHFGIDLIEQTAIATDGTPAAPIGTWNASLGSGQEWVWTKLEFLDQIEKGSNAIIAKTLRGIGNYIIAGNNVARVIRQLAPHFVPVSGLGKVVPTGPYVLGTLDGRTVIHDPFLKADRYIVGFKGDNFLFAGMIYAPYIPLFATPTLITSDLEAQKGFLSASGFHIVNRGMFTFGEVQNLI